MFSSKNCVFQGNKWLHFQFTRNIVESYSLFVLVVVEMVLVSQ